MTTFSNIKFLKASVFCFVSLMVCSSAKADEKSELTQSVKAAASFIEKIGIDLALKPEVRESIYSMHWTTTYTEVQNLVEKVIANNELKGTDVEDLGYQSLSALEQFKTAYPIL